MWEDYQHSNARHQLMNLRLIVKTTEPSLTTRVPGTHKPNMRMWPTTT